MNKIKLFKVLTPFVCAAIVFMGCPLTTKDNVPKENELPQKNYLSPPILPLISELPIDYAIKNDEIKNETTIAQITTEPVTTEPETESDTVESTTTESETEPITTAEPITTVESTTIIETPPQETIPPQTTTSPTTEIPNFGGRYPIAEYIFCYLKSAGLSNAAACGVMGNIMAESGINCTLDINYEAWNASSHCYGICQWKDTGLEKNKGQGINDLNAQIGHLLGTMPIRIPTNTWKKGYPYELFMQLQDPGEAARIFCEEYEICGNWSNHTKRATLAWEAYNYFMSIGH